MSACLGWGLRSTEASPELLASSPAASAPVWSQLPLGALPVLGCGHMAGPGARVPALPGWGMGGEMETRWQPRGDGCV